MNLQIVRDRGSSLAFLAALHLLSFLPACECSEDDLDVVTIPEGGSNVAPEEGPIELVIPDDGDARYFFQFVDNRWRVAPQFNELHKRLEEPAPAAWILFEWEEEHEEQYNYRFLCALQDSFGQTILIGNGSDDDGGFGTIWESPIDSREFSAMQQLIDGYEQTTQKLEESSRGYCMGGHPRACRLSWWRQDPSHRICMLHQFLDGTGEMHVGVGFGYSRPEHSVEFVKKLVARLTRLAHETRGIDPETILHPTKRSWFGALLKG